MSIQGDFVGKLFQTRNLAHRAHLNTPVYARHMALGDFYDNLVELADRYTEVYQGRYGLITDIPCGLPDRTGDIVGILEEDVTAFEGSVGDLSSGHPSLANIVADIIEEYRHTIYKLRFLA